MNHGSSLLRQLLRHITMVSKFLASVVQTLDSAIHRRNIIAVKRISITKTNCGILWIVIHPAAFEQLGPG